MFELREGDRLLKTKNKGGSVTRYVIDEYDKPVAKKCTRCLEMKGLGQFSNRSKNKFDGRDQNAKNAVNNTMKQTKSISLHVLKNTVKKTKNASLKVVKNTAKKTKKTKI